MHRCHRSCDHRYCSPYLCVPVERWQGVEVLVLLSYLLLLDTVDGFS